VGEEAVEQIGAVLDAFHAAGMITGVSLRLLLVFR
jgi:hypothetical protein